MTVTTDTRLVTFVGNGVTTEFPFTFPIPKATDLIVSLFNTETEVTTVLTTLQFSVTGIGDDDGGQVTYPLTGDPIASTIQLIIERTVEFIQENDITNQDGFLPDALEKQLDLTVMGVQQIAEANERAVKLRVGSEFTGIILPDPEDGTVIGWQDDQLENFDTATLTPGSTDATGPFTDRDSFDSEDAGFRFLATDLVPPLLYIRETAVAGVWSPGLPWGRGATGSTGEAFKEAVFVPGTMVMQYDSDVLPSSAFTWADFGTIGDVGSGADEESADFLDAFNNLRDSGWNAGTEDFAAGDVVFKPDRRGLMPLGHSAMGGTASVSRVQRLTTMNTTLSAATATPASLTDISVGMFILGNVNVPAATTVISIDNGAGTIEMSANATATASGVSTRFSIISDPEDVTSLGGADVHTLTEGQIVPVEDKLTDHDHNIPHDTAAVASGSGISVVTNLQVGSVNADTDTAHITIADLGNDEPHPQIPPVVVCNYIIYVAPAQVGPTIVPLGVGDRVWTYAGVISASAPGDGFIGLSAAPGTDPVTMYIDNEDSSGQDISAITSDLEIGDVVALFNLTRRGGYTRYTATEVPTTPAGFVQFAALEHQSTVNGGDFTVGDNIALSIERVGVQGADGATGAAAADYKGTSTTSLTIGTGSKVFTIEASKQFAAGQFILAKSDANPTVNFMHGVVVTYVGTTLTTTMTSVGGSGTFADWSLDISGPVGATGPAGPATVPNDTVRVATTVTGALATAYEDGDTIDGITLATSDLILIKDQAAPAENGIYVVQASGSPARDSDYDTYDEHVGKVISIQEGTVNADTLWLCTSNLGGTLETTAIDFAQVAPSATTTVEGLVEFGTTAEYRSNSANVRGLEGNEVWDALAEVALTSTSNAVAWDMGLGLDFDIDTLGENTTIGAPTNTTVGKKGRLRIVQDGTGTRTVAWNAVFVFGGGTTPVASTATGAEDIFYYDVVSSSRIVISALIGVA